MTVALTLSATIAGAISGASPAHAGDNPAQVKFENCAWWQLQQLAVIPEVGNVAMRNPQNLIWYDTDGIWVKGRPAEWVKMPGHWWTAQYVVRCSANGFHVINWWPGYWPWMASWQPANTAPAPYPF